MSRTPIEQLARDRVRRGGVGTEEAGHPSEVFAGLVTRHRDDGYAEAPVRQD
jgi:hypothetical protein